MCLHCSVQQVSRFITSDLSLVNSYDTWRGTVMYSTCTYLYMYNVHVHMYVSIHVHSRYKECVEADVED